MEQQIKHERHGRKRQLGHTRKAGEKVFLTRTGWEKAAGALVRLIVTSMWGDMTVLPACFASVGAAGAVGNVCSGEK